MLFSLLVARLLTPMLAGHFMRGEPKSAVDSPLMLRYLGWVEWAIAHRRRTLALAAATFILSLAIVPLIPTTFVPTTDVDQVQLQVELPPGARLDDSLQIGREVRARLRAGVPKSSDSSRSSAVRVASRWAVAWFSRRSVRSASR